MPTDTAALLPLAEECEWAGSKQIGGNRWSMIGQAHFDVSCDCCGDCEHWEAAPLVRGGFDLEGMLAEMRRLGWVIRGNLTYCSAECAGKGSALRAHHAAAADDGSNA